MKLYSWLLAQCYDFALRKTEQRCLGAWRRELLEQAAGQSLEIGAGTGANLPHYPPGLTLTLCEPDPFMRHKLQKKLPVEYPNIRICDCPAEQIEQPDQSVDTVVSTLVLCSVQDQQQAIREIHRVLKPGGQLLFIEHVRSSNSAIVRRQQCYEPYWRCISGNCHLTRATADQIETSGLKIERLQEADMTGAPSFVSRTLRGCARKPAG